MRSASEGRGLPGFDEFQSHIGCLGQRVEVIEIGDPWQQRYSDTDQGAGPVVRRVPTLNGSGVLGGKVPRLIEPGGSRRVNSGPYGQQ